MVWQGRRVSPPTPRLIQPRLLIRRWETETLLKKLRKLSRTGEWDIFYVSLRGLLQLKRKIDQCQEMSEKEFSDLVWPYDLQDSDMMVPVDMTKCEPRESVSELAQLGYTKACVEILKAYYVYHGRTKAGIPEKDWPKAFITASVWRQVLDDVDVERRRRRSRAPSRDRLASIVSYTHGED